MRAALLAVYPLQLPPPADADADLAELTRPAGPGAKGVPGGSQSGSARRE